MASFLSYIFVTSAVSLLTSLFFLSYLLCCKTSFPCHFIFLLPALLFQLYFPTQTQLPLPTLRGWCSPKISVWVVFSSLSYTFDFTFGLITPNTYIFSRALSPLLFNKSICPLYDLIWTFCWNLNLRWMSRYSANHCKGFLCAYHCSSTLININLFNCHKTLCNENYYYSYFEGKETELLSLTHSNSAKML